MILPSKRSTVNGQRSTINDQRLSHQIHHHAEEPQHHGGNTRGGGEGRQEHGGPFAEGDAVESGGGDLLRGVQQVCAGAVAENTRDLPTEEGRRQKQQSDQKHHQKSDAARASAVARKPRLNEYAEQVVAQMHHHGGHHRAGDVGHQRQKHTRKQVYGKGGEVEMQEGKEQRADGGGVQDAVLFMLGAKNAAEDQLLAEGGEDAVGQHQADGGAHRAVVGGGKGVVEGEGGLGGHHAAKHGQQGTARDQHQGRRQDQEQMGQLDPLQPQGLDVIHPPQTDVQVHGNGEDHELKQNDGEILALTGEEGGVDETGQKQQGVDDQHQYRGGIGYSGLARQKIPLPGGQTGE